MFTPASITHGTYLYGLLVDAGWFMKLLLRRGFVHPFANANNGRDINCKTDVCEKERRLATRRSRAVFATTRIYASAYLVSDDGAPLQG